VKPNRLAFDVTTGSRTGTVKLREWYGTVKLDQPDWVKTGNMLKVDATAPKGGEGTKPTSLAPPTP
ncbi:MAG: hypothetical protein AAGA56_23810, partial [Myxococcota bacterium]